MGALTVRRWLLPVAVCAAACLLPGTARAGVPAWTTYHHDGLRGGIDSDSTSPLAPSQLWQTPALDGLMWGQPLVYGSRVYVATENDTIYALDAATGSIVWQRHVAAAVDATQLLCGNIQPTVGITSTPVIDPATGRIYVVADTWDGSNASSIVHELYGLNLSDGSVAVGPVPVDPPGSTHTDQLQRASLALDAGKVIIGYGGNAGDCGNYHGWLVAVPEGGGALQAFEADSQPGDSAGAIWGAGNAPAIDSAGDVWIATGNGNSGSSFDFSESVIKLDSNLNVLDWWAPSNWSYLDTNDIDVGSTMPLLLPGGLVFEIGKQGVGYLLSASSLGHTGATPLYQATVCAGSWGGGIYYQGVIYIACSDGMYALALDTTAKRFAPLSTWTVDANGVSPPIEAGDLIWSADYNGSNLYGLDPSTGAESFVSGNLNGFEHFATPSAAGGRLFVANQDAGSAGDHVTAFLIANPPLPSRTAAAVSSSSNPAAAGRAITLTATVTPVPDAGTVSFTDGGKPIAGCSAVPVSAVSGQASCTTAFSSSGSHAIAAAYSGDSYYLGSSGALSQQVSASSGPGSSPAPVISHLRVKALHRKLRLSLTLSQPAKLIVTVSELVPGHVVRHSCRAGGRRGRRCRAALRRALRRLVGRPGRDAFVLRMSKLAPGRYSVSVVAVSASGRRSWPQTVVVSVATR